MTIDAQQLLAFERQMFLRPGGKEQAILDTFSCSITRYYQQLQLAIDDPASLAIDAQTVRRLQRLRARKSA